MDNLLNFLNTLTLTPTPLQTQLLSVAPSPSLPPLPRSPRLPSSLLKDNIKIWKLTLNKVKKYIDNNNKKPSRICENKEIKKLGMWLSDQNYNYRKRQKFMSYKIIRHLWEDFINEYNNYL